MTDIKAGDMVMLFQYTKPQEVLYIEECPMTGGNVVRLLAKDCDGNIQYHNRITTTSFRKYIAPPKFKVGDTVKTPTGRLLLITKLTENGYQAYEMYGGPQAASSEWADTNCSKVVL